MQAFLIILVGQETIGSANLTASCLKQWDNFALFSWFNYLSFIHNFLSLYVSFLHSLILSSVLQNLLFQWSVPTWSLLRCRRNLPKINIGPKPAHSILPLRTSPDSPSRVGVSPHVHVQHVQRRRQPSCTYAYGSIHSLAGLAEL